MTWRTVARQDSAVTVGTRSAKLLLAAVGLVVLLMGYVFPILTGGPVSTARFPSFVSEALVILVPFVGMLLSYNAVAGQRESGAIRLALSLPQSRWDVVLGTALSRVALVTAALVSSLLLAGVLVVYPFGELVVAPFVGFLALAVLFGAVWVGLGVAVSIAVTTKRRALVAGFSLVFLSVVFWDTAVEALTLGLDRAGLISGELPGPVRFLVGLEPSRVFDRATTGLVTPDASVGGPWYLNEWVALGLLVLWVVGPLGAAYYRFAGSDLS